MNTLRSSAAAAGLLSLGVLAEPEQPLMPFTATGSRSTGANGTTGTMSVPSSPTVHTRVTYYGWHVSNGGS